MEEKTPLIIPEINYHNSLKFDEEFAHFMYDLWEAAIFLITVVAQSMNAAMWGVLGTTCRLQNKPTPPVNVYAQIGNTEH